MQLLHSRGRKGGVEGEKNGERREKGESVRKGRGKFAIAAARSFPLYPGIECKYTITWKQ